MNNTVTALLRIVALAGGAVAGALLSRWLDEHMASQAREKVDPDKVRYAQGLGPMGADSQVDTVSNVYTIHNITSEEEEEWNEQ